MLIIGETGEGSGKYGNSLLSADFFCKSDMVLRNIITSNYKKRRKKLPNSYTHACTHTHTRVLT